MRCMSNTECCVPQKDRNLLVEGSERGVLRPTNGLLYRNLRWRKAIYKYIYSRALEWRTDGDKEG